MYTLFSGLSLSPSLSPLSSSSFWANVELCRSRFTHWITKTYHREHTICFFFFLLLLRNLRKKKTKSEKKMGTKVEQTVYEEPLASDYLFRLFVIEVKSNWNLSLGSSTFDDFGWWFWIESFVVIQIVCFVSIVSLRTIIVQKFSLVICCLQIDSIGTHIFYIPQKKYAI